MTVKKSKQLKYIYKKDVGTVCPIKVDPYNFVVIRAITRQNEDNYFIWYRFFIHQTNFHGFYSSETCIETEY